MPEMPRHGADESVYNDPQTPTIPRADRATPYAATSPGALPQLGDLPRGHPLTVRRLQEGAHQALPNEGQALRTETMIDYTRDFRIGRA